MKASAEELGQSFQSVLGRTEKRVLIIFVSNLSRCVYMYLRIRNIDLIKILRDAFYSNSILSMYKAGKKIRSV